MATNDGSIFGRNTDLTEGGGWTGPTYYPRPPEPDEIVFVGVVEEAYEHGFQDLKRFKSRSKALAWLLSRPAEHSVIEMHTRDAGIVYHYYDGRKDTLVSVDWDKRGE